MYNSNKQNIGILIGAGDISFIAVKKALQYYNKVTVIDFDNNFERFKKFDRIVYYKSYPGYLRKNLKILKKENIAQILFIGKLDKSKIFKEKRFDLTSIKLLLTLKDKSDFTILQRLVDWFKDKGIEVLSQKEFFKEHLMPQGYITKFKCNKKEIENIRFGFNIAKKIAALGIGQSIVVEDKMVIAVEGIEGTDEMIKRAGKYIKKNGVFIKVVKPEHNPKFDLPGFGTKTLKLLLKNSIKTIALESDWTLLIHKEKLVRFANENRMKILGIK